MSTNAEDPTVLLPEIEVSDLVDAIPIDIVGELFEEEEEDATTSLEEEDARPENFDDDDDED